MRSQVSCLSQVAMTWCSSQTSLDGDHEGWQEGEETKMRHRKLGSGSLDSLQMGGKELLDLQSTLIYTLRSLMSISPSALQPQMAPLSSCSQSWNSLFIWLVSGSSCSQGWPCITLPCATDLLLWLLPKTGKACESEGSTETRGPLLSHSLCLVIEHITFLIFGKVTKFLATILSL